jgi:hypothetical protein
MNAIFSIKKMIRAELNSVVEYDGKKGIVLADPDYKHSCKECLLLENDGKCAGLMMTASIPLTPCSTSCRGEPYVRKFIGRVYFNPVDN